MNTGTDIFILEKWWGKGITLIVTALVLAGCQSQAIPSTATATSTSTEIPATATLIPTNTPEPTATSTELVVPDNAVEIVGGGYVYVENGKVMQVGKDGVTKEIKDISSDVTFKNMEDAGDIFKVLYAEAISKFKRIDFFPDGPYDSVYAYIIDTCYLIPMDGVGTRKSESIVVAGKVLFFAQVDNPVKSSDMPRLAVAFMEVNDYPGLVPVVVGAFDKENHFSSIINGQRNYRTREFQGLSGGTNMSLPPTFAIHYAWDEIRSLLRDNILVFRTPFSVPPEELDNLVYLRDKNDPITPNMEVLRDELILFQAKHMGAAGAEIRRTQKPPLPKTGILLDMVDGHPDKNFFVVLVP